jgi:hypothetical protein
MTDDHKKDEPLYVRVFLTFCCLFGIGFGNQHWNVGMYSTPCEEEWYHDKRFSAEGGHLLDGLVE